MYTHRSFLVRSFLRITYAFCCFVRRWRNPDLISYAYHSFHTSCTRQFICTVPIFRLHPMNLRSTGTEWVHLPTSLLLKNTYKDNWGEKEKDFLGSAEEKKITEGSVFRTAVDSHLYDVWTRWLLYLSFHLIFFFCFFIESDHLHMPTRNGAAECYRCPYVIPFKTEAFFKWPFMFIALWLNILLLLLLCYAKRSWKKWKAKIWNICCSLLLLLLLLHKAICCWFYVREQHGFELPCQP